MQIFTLIPPGTWIAILALVVLPAIAGWVLRLNLYKELKGINSRVSRLLVSGEQEGIQPEIVKRLRIRYQNASQQLERVNTLSIIDSIYKDQELSLLRLKIQFDRADSITKALPNLLIAFGLIGTFAGITSNLTSISSIVTGFSQTNPDVSRLVEGLQSPLRDMGVAFSTSLFGLVFGSALTIVNTFFNTSIAKYQLISSLEDYLDNIYKPTVEGNTRLDLAIDRMVKQQEEFLTRFHENVGVVLERSFGQAARQIAEECGRTNKIAEYVYSNFSNAAGTISTGATTFQLAAISLAEQTQTVMRLMPQLEDGVATFASAANKVETNKVITRLNTLVENLSITQSAFTSSTQTFLAGVDSIMSIHLQSTQSAEKAYQELGKTTISIQSGANDFVSAARIIRDSSLAVDLASAANNFQEAQNRFTESTTSIQSGANDFVSAARIIRDSSLAVDLASAANNFQEAQDRFTESTTIFSQAATELQPIASKLEPTIASLDRAVNSLQQVGSEIANLSRSNL